MIADINIISINPINKLSINSEIFTCVLNNHDVNANEKVYVDTWKLLNSTCSFWYDVSLTSTIKDGTAFYSSGDILDLEILSSFDQIIELKSCNREIKVLFNEKYLDEFKRIISAIKESSSNNLVVVLFRLQENETERIYGVGNIDKFVKLLEQGKIYYNVAYIIN